MFSRGVTGQFFSNISIGFYKFELFGGEVGVAPDRAKTYSVYHEEIQRIEISFVCHHVRDNFSVS